MSLIWRMILFMMNDRLLHLMANDRALQSCFLMSKSDDFNRAAQR